MTEAEWLTSTSVGDMLRFLRYTTLGPGESVRARKYRLFAVACARRAWDSLRDVDCDAVLVAEQWADKLVSDDGVQAARESGAAGIARKTLLKSPRMAATDSAIGTFRETATHPFLRCIFGNPFRPVTFAPEWRTETAVALAQTMYDARDFGNLPILADALQDAGCENTDVLDHCRGPGPNVRGCWVVDLVLGKE